jgi:outer membrane protein assembly factor BamA
MAAAGLEVTGWIDRAALERTLTELYRAEGYLTARIDVGDPVLEPGRAVLPVQIDEGTRAVVGKVRFDGVADERLALVEAETRLEPGTPYALRTVNQARQRVDRRYRQWGFNAVEVSAAARPDDAGEVVDVELTVAEGVRQILQDVVTTGTSRTREGVVTRALRLPLGEPVNLEQWSLARKRLFDTNVFRSVDIQAVPIGDPVDGDQPVRARVTVEEYPHWRLRYGFQVDRERVEEGVDGRFELNPGAIGEIRNQNLLGRALTAGVATRVERDFQRLNLFGQAPGFFGLPVRSSVFAYASTENIRDDGAVLAVTDVQGISFEQRWRRQRSLELTYSYRYEFNRTYDPNPPLDSEFPPLDQRVRVARLSAALLLDRRDDPVNATRGTFTSVAVEQLANWLGADVGYARLLAQQLAFVRLGPAVVASRAVTGYVFGDSLLDNLLFQDRFFAGGGTTVRGYAENGLGPRDIFGASRGGSQVVVANAELRFPLYRWVSGVGFLDAGGAFDDQSPFRWGGLKVGYGAGLRVNSPIGLLRLDFGIPAATLPATSRLGTQLGSGRWYFGIGQVF